MLKSRGFVPRLVAVAAGVMGLVGTAVVGVGASPAAAVDPLVVEQVNAFSAFDSSVYKSVRATCPPGKQVIGTGFQLLGAEGSVVLDDLIPDQTSVLVGAGEVVGPGEPADGTTERWQIEATALCVPISSMTLRIVSKTQDYRATRPGTPFERAWVGCPRGTWALGSGLALSNGFGQVAPGVLSPLGIPTPDGHTLDGAEASAAPDLDGYSEPWSITVYAICGPRLPGLDLDGSPDADIDSRSPKTAAVACPAGKALLSLGFTSGYEYQLAMRQVLVTKAAVGLNSGSANGVTASATERAPGTSLTWDWIAMASCADGSNAPIVTPFNLNGRYDVGFGASRPATIRETRGIVSVDQSAFGRPTGRGGVTDNNHITVDFPDDQTYTATLVAPDRIVWSNGSVWPKLPEPVGPIRGIAGKCVEVLLASTDNGTPTQIITCSGHIAQTWRVGFGGTLEALGKCLDIAGAATTNGTPIQLHECHNHWAQVWQPGPGGILRNPFSGKCLDTADHGSGEWTRLVLWQCTGIPSQRWTLPTA